jgi:hypothetical protein
MTDSRHEPSNLGRVAATLVRRAAYELRTVVARYPAVALPLARLRRRGHPFDRRTEVVIEGFPRSGTSFAVSAFEYPQPRKPVVAHHVHSPSQIIAAARAGLPALLLIREPEDSALSLVVRRPELTIGQVLRGYVRFYGPLLAYRNRVVVATFDQVISDYGAVVERVNARFRTSWRPFPHTEENVRGVLRAIDRYTRPEAPDDDAFDRIVARPAAARDELKDALRARYASPRLRRVRSQAERLYAMFAKEAIRR